MRVVIDALERLGIDYFAGCLRLRRDAPEPGHRRRRGARAPGFRSPGRRAAAGVRGRRAERLRALRHGASDRPRDRREADLILRRPGPFERSAMERRRHADIPGLGLVWVASVEDLVLAKLVWSEGTSELQHRDCQQLLRINTDSVDRGYLERWAVHLGVADRLRQVS